MKQNRVKSSFFLMLFVRFHQEKFVGTDILCIFAPLVPAEPLYNA